MPLADAEQLFRRALEIQPGTVALWSIRLCLHDAGRLEMAAQALQRVGDRPRPSRRLAEFRYGRYRPRPPRHRRGDPAKGFADRPPVRRGPCTARATAVAARRFRRRLARIRMAVSLCRRANRARRCFGVVGRTCRCEAQSGYLRRAGSWRSNHVYIVSARRDRADRTLRHGMRSAAGGTVCALVSAGDFFASRSQVR